MAGPSLAPDLIGGCPGSGLGALPWIRADLRMILFALGHFHLVSVVNTFPIKSVTFTLGNLHSVAITSEKLKGLDLLTPENLKELNALVEGNFFLYPLQRFRA